MTTQTSAAERRSRLHGWTRSAMFDAGFPMPAHRDDPEVEALARAIESALDAALAEARRDEREKVVAKVRRGLWFLNPTQQAKAEEVYAAALSADATGAEGGDDD